MRKFAKIATLFMLPVGLIIFIIAVFASSLNLGLIGLVVLWCACATFAFEDLSKRFVLLLYLVAFFVFLLGGYFASLLHGEQWWTKIGDESVIFKSFVLIALSLLFTILGEQIFEKRSFNKKNQRAGNESFIKDAKRIAIQRVCIFLFWATLPFVYYKIIDIIIFVRNYSYLEYYTAYGGVGKIIEVINTINTTVFFLYLGTMPKKQNAKWAIYALGFIKALSILGGQRNDAVTFVMIMLVYYYYRESVRHELAPKWLPRWLKRTIIISIPFGIAFLGIWNTLRSGGETNLGFIGSILTFFKDQGGSVNLISYAQVYKDQMPATNINYTFGPIINFAKYNIVTDIFFDFPKYADHTVEAALYNNSFGQTITYLVMPWNYVVGIGLGSSYIAEVYVDFGVVGVIIFNLFLGWLLSRYANLKQKGPFAFAFLFLILKNLFLLPRNTALSWFVAGFNLTVLGVFFLISTGAEYMVKTASAVQLKKAVEEEGEQ